MVGLAASQPAHSQPAPAGTSIEDILPLTNDPNDPIGFDQEQQSLGRIAEPEKQVQARGRDAGSPRGSRPEAPAVRAGEVLTAVPTVRESAQTSEVELEAGLLLVTTELSFDNSAARPADVHYRLAVPDDAALAALSVCNEAGCRSGRLHPDTLTFATDEDAPGGPTAKPDAVSSLVARAEKVSDARGTALVLHAGPVVLGKPLTLHLAYTSAATMHGGGVRARLPPRGMDPRAAPLALRVRSKSLLDVRIGEVPVSATPALFDPWAEVEISARSRPLAPLATQLWHFPCGVGRCARFYAALGPGEPEKVDMVLAVDVSPSMEGPARTRLTATLAAILARTPPGSRVRVLTFASQALPLMAAATEPGSVPLSIFSQLAFEAEQGSATRFEAAWHLIDTWGFSGGGHLKRMVVIVGDGGLTTGAVHPFELARRKGVEVCVVNVSDRPCIPPLAQGARATRGVVIDAGAEADDAVRGKGAERLEERLAALFARPGTGALRLRVGMRILNFGTLREGESLLFEGESPSPPWLLAGTGRSAAQPAPPLMAASLATRGAAASAEPRHAPDGSTSKPPGGESGPQLGTGMPGSPLLSMLRQRIVPVARGCFRKDRAGRPDYQVRAVFEFRLAEREVVSAQVTGKIAEELRACLLAAVDTLAVPRFSGTVLVRYPLVTEREALPSEIELTPNTAERLDEVLHSR